MVIEWWLNSDLMVMEWWMGFHLGISTGWGVHIVIDFQPWDDWLRWFFILDGRKPPNSHVLMVIEASKFKKYGGINNRISWGCNESYYVFSWHNGLKCQFWWIEICVLRREWLKCPFMFTVRYVPCVIFCSFKTGFVDERIIIIDRAFRLCNSWEVSSFDNCLPYMGICIGHAIQR